MDHTLFGTDPAQLLLARDRAPEATHVGGDVAQASAQHDRRQRVDRGHAHLGAATKREGEAVAFEAVVRVGAEDDVCGRVVGRCMHGVRAGERARGRKAHVVGGHGDDAVPPHAQPLTAPTSRPRAMKRSSAIAIAITGPIMIRISTDMYHH